MTVHYTILGGFFNIIFLLQEYVLLIQYSLVFFYFISQLYKSFKALKEITYLKFIMIASNAVMLLGFLIYIGILGSLGESFYNCNNGIWIYLHGCGVLLSLAFLVIGIKATKLLKVLKQSNNLIIKDEKIKQFWYVIIRIIIWCMIIASLVNLGESFYFINIDNFDCYNSYSNIPDLDIFIFCFIRFFSHYLFVIGCLYTFRQQRIMSINETITTESNMSIIVASYYGDSSFDDYVKNSVVLNSSDELKRNYNQ
jgi:hypothetical protein